MFRIIGAAIAALTLAAAASPASALENFIYFGDQYPDRPWGYADGDMWREGRAVVRTEFNELPVDNALTSAGYVWIHCCYNGPIVDGLPSYGRGLLTGLYLDGNTDVELITGSGETMIFHLDGQEGLQFFAPYIGYSSLLQFRPINTGPGSYFKIDNVYFNAVPEPATWAMMISGFGAAGAMLRRRRAAPLVSRA